MEPEAGEKSSGLGNTENGGVKETSAEHDQREDATKCGPENGEKTSENGGRDNEGSTQAGGLHEERGNEAREEQTAGDGREDGEVGTERVERTSEGSAAETVGNSPQEEENAQQRPAAARRLPKNRVQSWYRWKRRCKEMIKAGLEKHDSEGIALFCTLSPHGRWQTRGSQALIGDPAFPVIEQQLQRLAAAKHELSAARAGILRTATQRRREEREAAAETATQPETQYNAENQRRPSKVVRAKARLIAKTAGFQGKLVAVLNGAKACNKEVCRAEHQTALADAPCYAFRQAMGWPDSVPFTSAIGDLTTKEQSDFVATFAAYEDLQPMNEGEQGGQGEPERTATERGQPGLGGSAAVTIRAIYAFLRSCQMTVPSRKPRVKGVQVSLDILATRIIQAGGHLQFRRRNGYVAFVYSKEGLNFDGQGKAAEGEDSDALDLKEEDAVKKLKGLYARYLKGYVESTLGEEGDEGDTESEDDESDWGSGGDGKPDEGEQNEREKKTDGWEETDSGEEQTDQEAETESSLSGGVDSEELEFLKGDEVEHLSGWQEDYLRWAEESEVPPHEAPPRRARVQKAHLAERSGAQKATGPEQETARRTNGRSEPPEQPESDRPASDPFGDPEEADKLSFGIGLGECVMRNCVIAKNSGSRLGTQHVCGTCQGPVHNLCVQALVGESAGGYFCDKHYVPIVAPSTRESAPDDTPIAGVTNVGPSVRRCRRNEDVPTWKNASPIEPVNVLPSEHPGSETASAAASRSAAPGRASRPPNQVPTAQKSAPLVGPQPPANPDSDNKSAPVAAPTGEATAGSSRPLNQPSRTESNAPPMGEESSRGPPPGSENVRPATAPTEGETRPPNQPLPVRNNAPSEEQERPATRPTPDSESAFVTAPTSGALGGSSQPPHQAPCAGGNLLPVAGNQPGNPLPGSGGAFSAASATAPTSAAPGKTNRDPTQVAPAQVNAPPVVQKTPASPTLQSKTAPENAPASTVPRRSSGPSNQSPLAERNALPVLGKATQSPLPGNSCASASVPRGGLPRPTDQHPAARENAPPVGQKTTPSPAPDNETEAVPASVAPAGTSRPPYQPSGVQCNAFPQEGKTSSHSGSQSAPPAGTAKAGACRPPYQGQDNACPEGVSGGKKRGREVDEARGSSGGSLYRKKRTAAGPQNRAVSRLAPSQLQEDVTEIFDAPGTEIYADDVLRDDGTLQRGPEWHARFSQPARKPSRWRAKKAQPVTKPRKEEPRFRKTNRGLQILVPYQWGSHPQWVSLEKASFDEMNRLAAVASIEPSERVRGETVEEIESRYRSAIYEAANKFFLSNSK